MHAVSANQITDISHFNDNGKKQIEADGESNFF